MIIKLATRHGMLLSSASKSRNQLINKEQNGIPWNNLYHSVEVFFFLATVVKNISLGNNLACSINCLTLSVFKGMLKSSVLCGLVATLSL